MGRVVAVTDRDLRSNAFGPPVINAPCIGRPKPRETFGTHAITDVFRYERSCGIWVATEPSGQPVGVKVYEETVRIIKVHTVMHRICGMDARRMPRVQRLCHRAAHKPITDR